MPYGRAAQANTTVGGICSVAAPAYWLFDDKPVRPLVTNKATPTIATATPAQVTGCALGASAVSVMPKKSTLSRPRNCGTTMAEAAVASMDESAPSFLIAAELPIACRCQTVQVSERKMSDEHKAAIAAGRIEAAAVSDYLEVLEAKRPKPGRRMNPDKLQQRRAELDSELGSGSLKPMKRLEAMQAIRNIDAQLAALSDEPDTAAVEAGFVKHAVNYGQRKGIQYAIWREAGVPADLLAKARISRGQ